MTRCASAFLVAFAALAPIVGRAQPTPKPPAGIDDASPYLALRALFSNSLTLDLKDIIISSVTVEARASSGRTDRRQYKPLTLRMTAPAGAGMYNPKELQWKLGIASGDGTTQQFTYQKIESVVLALSLAGASCSARVPASFDEGGKLVTAQLGDLAAFFDAQRKPVAAKCSAG